MRLERLAWPDRTDLARRIVADRYDEVELGGGGRRKLVPGFRSELGGVVVKLLQQLDRVGIDYALGEGAGRPGGEFPGTLAVHDRFGENRAGGVASAEEEDVIGGAHRGSFPVRDSNSIRWRD